MATRKALKTYHGIPKTPIDDSTVFYASMDGSVVPEVGNSLPYTVTGAFSNIPTATGLGIKSSSGDSSIAYALPIVSSGSITVDTLIKVDSVKSTKFSVTLYDSDNVNYSIKLSHAGSTDDLHVAKIINGVWGSNLNLNTYNLINVGVNHVRMVIDMDTKLLKTYVNGKYIDYYTIPLTDVIGIIKKFDRLGIWSNSSGTAIISDIAVSYTDRGSDFPTLPKDFIDGYAKISNAFTLQRNVYADPVVSQPITEVVKAKNEGRPFSQTVTQATSGVWASGDKIKIKGLAGEVISGLVDSDTAVAKIVSVVSGLATSTLVVITDTTNGMVVNDTYKVLLAGLNSVSTITFTVSAISGNQVTLTGDMTTSGTDYYTGGILVENTASSSVPVVKFVNAGTLTAVTGTWSNLGTSEATFTLGTNAGLASQDLQVSYSLNMVSGQGGISEVLTGVTGGEINAKIYEPSLFKGTLDFAGKIPYDAMSNPNFMYLMAYASLSAPTSFTSEGTYGGIQALGDGSEEPFMLVNGDAGARPQQCFVFDLIAYIESKYGIIPAADKGAWVKANVASVVCNWYGSGMSNWIYKAYFAMWDTVNSNWSGAVSSHSNPYTTLITRASLSPANYIDSFGRISFLAYADPYNGTDVSSISTDYISLDVTLKPSARFAFAGIMSPVLSNRRLIVNPTLHVKDDFMSKAIGSYIENPNVAKMVASNSLLAPSNGSFVEINSSGQAYGIISSPNGICYSNNSGINGNMIQQLYAFNIVEIIERKFGEIPSVDKVQWCKDNLYRIDVNWLGYGVCPTGYRAYLMCWYTDTNTWGTWKGNGNSGSGQGNSTSTPSNILYRVDVGSGGFTNRIDASGNVYYLAYTDASNGTVASTIYTDYVDIEIMLKTPTGYDVLVPENPRRDDGQANLILVRKETKEVQTMFAANNEDGISTIGNYNVSQATAAYFNGGMIMSSIKSIITSITTKMAAGAKYYSKTKFDLLDEFKVIDTVINSGLANGLDLENGVYSSLICNVLDTYVNGFYALYKRNLSGKIWAIGSTTIQLDEGGQYLLYGVNTFRDINPAAKYVVISAFIYKDTTGALYLVLMASTRKELVGNGSNTRIIYYPLPNRPLVK